MSADLSGNLTITFSVVSVFLLVLGLPLVRGLSNKKNLKRHGALTVVALVLEAVLIFVVMVPSFIQNFSAITALPIGFAINTWLHIASGASAFISGLVYIALWLAYYNSGLRCAKAKKYMTPTLIVWIIAIVSGAAIFLLQMF